MRSLVTIGAQERYFLIKIVAGQQNERDERVKETGTSRRIIEENKVEKSLDTVHNRVNLNYKIFKGSDRKNKILKICILVSMGDK